MIKTELNDHQRRIKDKLKNTPGLIAAHGLGSGKTLSAINTIDTTKPVYIITPASLQENFKKEVSTHSGIPLDKLNILSYEKFLQKPEFAPDSQVIIDEAHRLRNTDTKTYKSIKDAVHNTRSRLLLTATPIYNNPSDIASLVNVAANKRVLPATQKDFNNLFIEEQKVNPGIVKSMMGVKPGVKYTMKNQQYFKAKVSPYIDRYAPPKNEDYPEVKYRTDDHLISAEQNDIYKYVLGKAPLSTRLKVRYNLPPNKSESKNMNSFLAAARQVSDSAVAFGSPESESPKIKSIADHIQKRVSKDPKFKALIYSNYLDAGITPTSQSLSNRGITHGDFTGKLTSAQKKVLVDKFNSGEMPVLLVSSAGSEGLDLKGTREVHIMEPHWNNEKIKQVVGRSARYKSHEALPLDQRSVDVYYHRTVLPQGKLSKMLGFKRPTSTDEYIQNRANDKEILMQQFMDALNKR